VNSIFATLAAAVKFPDVCHLSEDGSALEDSRFDSGIWVAVREWNPGVEILRICIGSMTSSQPLELQSRCKMMASIISCI
jgi:hypothetical protein